MKSKILFIMTALLLVAVPSFGQSAQAKKIAILETVDKEGSISYGIKLMLRSSLSYAITNTPGYEGYDRVDLESIVGEQTFQRTGMVSDEQIKKLGEMTGASYILVAEVARVDDTHIFITAKILNVETAKLESTANVQTLAEAKDIEAGCKRLAAMLLGTGSGLDVMPESTADAAENISWLNMTVAELANAQQEKRAARQEAKRSRNEDKLEAAAAVDSIRRMQDETMKAYYEQMEDSREVPEGITPGMKYHQYRKLYKASDYVRMPGDRYSPLAGGLCSFFIPGLGQAVNGNVGRGLAFFGGYAACLVVVAGGSNIVNSAYYSSSGKVEEEDSFITGSIVMLAGVVAMVGVDIWAIIDGVQHAKIKNMYLRDVTRLSSVDIKLNPYIASTATPFGYGASPAFGLSLKVTF